MAQSFSLVPFAPVATLTLTGEIARDRQGLVLHYHLEGEVVSVEVPPPADVPSRTQALWEQTCFELFFGELGRDRYWEFNLSPSGNWNVYQLDGYRQGLREERLLSSLPFTVQHQPQELSIQISVNLEDMISPHAVLEVAITAVIQSVDGNVSYWALTHCGPEADFHLRDSFAIVLPPAGDEPS